MIHDKLLPWRMAQFRKLAVAHMTVCTVWWTVYWNTAVQVLWPEGKK